jgi:DnaA family protein
LDIKLGDLQSRLQSGLMLQIKDLNDSEKISLLQLRAENRGMKLPDAVAEFILLRADRSIVGLMRVLDKLDTRSLQEKRSLTVPLVKECMGW